MEVLAVIGVVIVVAAAVYGISQIDRRKPRPGSGTQYPQDPPGGGGQHPDK